MLFRSNPTGAVLPAQRLAEIVQWARSIGAVVVSDECYIELGWDAEPVSILHPSANAGSHEGLIALHSLSKRSNFAGYRFGFAAGDPALIKDVLAVRKHAGMMVPTPVQAAAVAADASAARLVEFLAADGSTCTAAALLPTIQSGVELTGADASLLVLDPTIQGHSGLVTMDVGVAAFGFLFLWRILRYRDNPTWTNVVWCGASLACTLGAKFSGALFVPIALALLLVQNDKPGGLLKPIGVTALIAYALIHAMYMFPADPLVHWHGMRQVNANHNADYAVYLAGQFQIKPFSYFFYTYVLKEPLPTALLAMLGLAWTVTDKKRSIQQKAFLVLPGLGWFVAHLFLADPLGIRYIIVTVVAGHILGGFAIARLWGTARYVATALLAWEIGRAHV